MEFVTVDRPSHVRTVVVAADVIARIPGAQSGRAAEATGAGA